MLTIIGSFFANLWAKAQVWLLAALAVVVALAFVFFRGKREGKKEVQQEAVQQRIEAIQEKREVENEVDALPPADVDVRLDKWLRD